MAQQSKSMPFNLVRNLSELLDKQVGMVEANEEISKEVFGEPDFYSVTGFLVEYQDFRGYISLVVSVYGLNSKGEEISFLFKCNSEPKGLTIEFISDKESQDKGIPFTEESFGEFYMGVQEFLKPFYEDIQKVRGISRPIDYITVEITRDGSKFSYVSKYSVDGSELPGDPFTGRFRVASKYKKITSGLNT